MGIYDRTTQTYDFVAFAQLITQWQAFQKYKNNLITSWFKKWFPVTLRNIMIKKNSVLMMIIYDFLYGHNNIRVAVGTNHLRLVLLPQWTNHNNNINNNDNAAFVQAQRIHYLIKSLISAIPSHYFNLSQKKNIIILIEGYAYKISNSSAVTKMAEIGGSMRNKIIEMFNGTIPFYEIGPTALKKKFTGNGQANKIEMWEQFQKLQPVAAKTLKDLLPGSWTNDVPKPIQDIVDAFALLFTHL